MFLSGVATLLRDEEGIIGLIHTLHQIFYRIEQEAIFSLFDAYFSRTNSRDGSYINDLVSVSNT